jgi:DNA-binding transcriptional regulator PaaX
MVMSSRTAATKAVMELLGFLNHHQSSKKGSFLYEHNKSPFKKIHPATYHQKITKLIKLGLVQKKNTEKNTICIITQKAKTIRAQAITKRTRTDGLSTLIIFDIPEALHRSRDTFRRYLIRSGYTQLRKSTFVSPFQITEDLKLLVTELKIEKNVSFFSAKPEYLQIK